MFRGGGTVAFKTFEYSCLTLFRSLPTAKPKTRFSTISFAFIVMVACYARSIWHKCIWFPSHCMFCHLRCKCSSNLLIKTPAMLLCGWSRMLELWNLVRSLPAMNLKCRNCSKKVSMVHKQQSLKRSNSCIHHEDFLKVLLAYQNKKFCCLQTVKSKVLHSWRWA